MKKLRFLLSLTTKDNDYQLEQAAAAQEAARRLGVDLETVYADNNAITQSTQILQSVQGGTADTAKEDLQQAGFSSTRRDSRLPGPWHNFRFVDNTANRNLTLRKLSDSATTHPITEQMRCRLPPL